MPWATRTNAPPRLRGRASQARRARILARDPVCRICLVRPSTIADHIVNLASGGADDELNMQGVCGECHVRKTTSESRRPTRTRQAEAHPRLLR